MKVIGIVLLSVLAGFLYSVAWSFAFSLINSADDLLVFMGIILIGLLLGCFILGITYAVEQSTNLTRSK